MTLDEHEAILDMLGHPGFKPFLAMCEGIVQGVQWEVVHCPSNDEKEVIRRHVRAEGAAKLLHAIKSRCEALKPKKES